MISSLLFALGFLSLSTSNNRQLLQTPITPFSLFDGTQVIYATIPDLNGPGLSAITLGTNEVISNVIGIFDGGELQPVDASNPEIIRSATIDPITNQLILLYQEMLDTSSDPQQRFIRIAPSSLFGLLSTQYSNIMAMEVGDVDIDGLTEITFDCAGNLIGITRKGEIYAFEVDGIEIEEIDDPIGQLTVGIMDTALTDVEFTGLTYNWLSDTFVAVGAPAFGQAGSILIEFTILDCVLTQSGTGTIISDPDGLCFGEGDGGIIDIEFRGQSEYVVSCMDSLGNIGLAVLINDGVNVPLIAPFVASGDTPGLIEIGNSFGGALIPSIDADGDGINELGIPPLNLLCFGIGEIDCDGDGEVADVVAPIFGVGRGGFSIGALDGTVGGDTSAVEADGTDGEDGEDVSELEEELEETLESLEEEVEDVVSEEEELEEEAASDEEDDDGEDDESTDDGDDNSEDDDDDDNESQDDDDDDDGSDDESNDESDDDNEDDGSDDDDDDDYDGDSDDDDDDDDDDDSEDDDDDDDDEDDDDDSNDYDFFDGAEGISNEYRNGFFSNSNEYGETVISLSESTLANLWGIGLLFLLINISFLVICYYKHWMKKQNHDTIEEVIDLES